MGKRQYTNLYVSLSKEDDQFIDVLRVQKIKEDKQHYTKTQVVTHLMNLGKDIINEKYLKLDPEIDKFVSQLQTMVIELGNGEKATIRKSKQQVYNMLIEKGLQHLND